MAFTMTNVVTNTVIGDYKVRMFDINCDGAAGSVDTGMGRIYAALVSAKSNASGSANLPIIPRVLENLGPSGTSIVGTLALTSCVSGDTYKVIVFAKG